MAQDPLCRSRPHRVATRPSLLCLPSGGRPICGSRANSMAQRVAIVTGGLRGLGRAMTFGLAREGHHVVAVGHIDADIAEVEAETVSARPDGQILPLVADLRRPADCDRVVAMTLARFGRVHL